MADSFSWFQRNKSMLIFIILYNNFGNIIEPSLQIHLGECIFFDIVPKILNSFDFGFLAFLQGDLFQAMRFLVIKYLLPFSSQYFASQRTKCSGNIESDFLCAVHTFILIIYMIQSKRIKDLAFMTKFDYPFYFDDHNCQEIVQKVRKWCQQCCIQNITQQSCAYLKVLQTLLQQQQKHKSKRMAKVLKAVVNTSLAALRHQKYAFRPLNQSHTKQAIELLALEFQSQQPLTNAVFKQSMTQKAEKISKWRDFWTAFSEDFLSNQYSVGCFDLQKGDELIGISVAKDLNYVPDNFQKDYMDTNSFIAPVIRLQEQLLKQIKPQYQPLLAKKDIIMDIWGVALKKEHMGKRLLHKMMDANQILGRQRGFKYGFCYASNFKTGKALSKLDYEKVAEMNVLQYVQDGSKPFALIDDLYKNPSLWMKKLDNENRLY